MVAVVVVGDMSVVCYCNNHSASINCNKPFLTFRLLSSNEKYCSMTVRKESGQSSYKYVNSESCISRDLVTRVP